MKIRAVEPCCSIRAKGHPDEAGSRFSQFCGKA